jgi:type VI secretion system protein ImpC
LIGDFEFDRTPSDMYLLEQISHVAAAAHAPFISAASSNMLGLESFTDIDRPRDVSKFLKPLNMYSGVLSEKVMMLVMLH